MRKCVFSREVRKPPKLGDTIEGVLKCGVSAFCVHTPGTSQKRRKTHWPPPQTKNGKAFIQPASQQGRHGRPRQGRSGTRLPLHRMVYPGCTRGCPPPCAPGESQSGTPLPVSPRHTVSPSTPHSDRRTGCALRAPLRRRRCPAKKGWRLAGFQPHRN